MISKKPLDFERTSTQDLSHTCFFRFRLTVTAVAIAGQLNNNGGQR